MEGDCETFGGGLGRQPSYPLLVLKSFTSLTLHSDLNSAPCSSSRGWPKSWAHPPPCSLGLSMMKESLLGSENSDLGAEVRVGFVTNRFA